MHMLCGLGLPRSLYEQRKRPPEDVFYWIPKNDGGRQGRGGGGYPLTLQLSLLDLFLGSSSLDKVFDRVLTRI